jgi:hypothetical protein
MQTPALKLPSKAVACCASTCGFPLASCSNPALLFFKTGFPAIPSNPACRPLVFTFFLTLAV